MVVSMNDIPTTRMYRGAWGAWRGRLTRKICAAGGLGRPRGLFIWTDGGEHLCHVCGWLVGWLVGVRWCCCRKDVRL
jgi:hypothetical protein